MAKRDVSGRKAFRQGELLFVPLSKDDYARLFGDHKDLPTQDGGNWKRRSYEKERRQAINMKF